jgi:membrane fusion protein, multidrug efflux system
MSGDTGAHHHRPWRSLLVLAAVILLGGAGVLYYLETLHSETTDDATVQADIVAVMAKVPGYVQTLRVDDNSVVKKDQLLLTIDPRDYALQVASASTALDAAQSRLTEAKATVEAAAADTDQYRADAAAAETNSALAQDIANRRMKLTELSVSTENKDTVTANAETAKAAADAARSKVAAADTRHKLAEAQEQTAEVGVTQARVVLDQAKLNLSYTNVVSAVDGTVANRTIVAGNYVQPGQLLLSLVPETVYVVANFKETQMAGIVAGQKARIRVDALGGQRFQGHVDSVQRGSGSVFALLPPENATGNFVKVVQRIPVKVVFDGPAEDVRRLAPGMSVEVTIDTTGR